MGDVHQRSTTQVHMEPRRTMVDRDNSKIREDLSAIQGVSKQSLFISTVIKVDRYDISSLKTKQCETKNQ